MYVSFRYPTPAQSRIWLRRRQKIPPSEIAREFKVSRPFVSKAQRVAEGRIKTLLEHASSVNRIKVQHLSPRDGIAVGYCPAHQMDTYILFSPSIGLQIWFDHDGNCGSCMEEAECRETLVHLADEWEIPLNNKRPPSELAEYIFGIMKRRLEWE